MPFGLGKRDKDKDADLDKQKSSLFGGRSKSSTNGSKSSATAPQSANPYAVPPPSSDPYAAKSNNPYANQGGNDPYAPNSSRNDLKSSFGNLSVNDNGPPPGYGASQRGPSPVGREKSPVPPGGYGGGPPRYPTQQDDGGYGQGYGSDPYGSGSGSGAGISGGQSRYGPSGYGGLGRSNSQDTMNTEAGRNALFGDAAQRQAVQAAQSPGPEQPQDNSYSGDGLGFGGESLGYGSAPDRQLTAEEQEEEDVQAAKHEIRHIKQQDVSSTRNARRVAEQAEQTGRETLARLGAQGERIHNTEHNLDSASNQNRLAEEKARELKTLNRSMFAVHVANPFTAKKREEAANAIALEKHQRERGQAEATRAAAYSSQARQQGQARDLNGNVVRAPQSKASLAERAKFQFEADSEDDEMENEIDDNLYVLAPIPLSLGLMSGIDADFEFLGRLSNAALAFLSSLVRPWVMSLTRRMSISPESGGRRIRLMIRLL